MRQGKTAAERRIYTGNTKGTIPKFLKKVLRRNITHTLIIGHISLEDTNVSFALPTGVPGVWYW